LVLAILPGAGRYNKRMAQYPDVLILGGGVIGLTTAHFLAEAGARVTVLDRGDLGRQASWAGAGIIPPGNRATARTPFEQLLALSVALYPTLSQQLRDATGIDNGYVVCGGIELIESEIDLSADEWRAEGITADELGSETLHRMEPGLAPRWRRGFFLPDMAQVRNPRHLQALLTSCRQQGVQLRPHCAARSLVRARSHITAVETETGRLEAGRYLLTAGAWSDELLAPLGWRPGIVPVRGQIALLNTGVPGVRPLLLSGKRYLVPRGDGLLLVGSTEELAGFDPRPTAGGVSELLAFAASVLPALAQAHLERCWAGLRPGSPDGLPFLGPVPGVDNLLVGAGHYRAGLQLSPGSGLVLKEMLLKQQTSVPMDAFGLDRSSRPRHVSP
jgi:glycine oxidase